MIKNFSTWLKRLGFLVAFLAVPCFIAPPCFADLPTLIPRQVLFGNPRKSGAQISPDGKRLAYLAPHKGVLNVWVQTMGQKDEHVVTDDRKRGIRVFCWQQDSAHILYIQDHDGDENFHIYQTEILTQHTRDLTPCKGIRAAFVEISASFPEEILIEMNLRDRKLQDVYRVNLKSGALDLDTKNPGDISGWTADNAMAVRAAQATLADGSIEIRVRKDGKSPWTVCEHWGADDSGGHIVGFSADNRSLYLESTVNSNAMQLVEKNLETGSTKVIAGDKDYDVSEVFTHPRTHHLLAVKIMRARGDWVVLDKTCEADFETLRKFNSGDCIIMNTTDDLSRWIVAYMNDDRPLKIYQYDRHAGKVSFLFDTRPELERYTMSKMKPISFEARDGLIIHGYLTVPEGVEPKNLPLVLNVHGGPWHRDQWGFNREVQWMANRGYAVLQLNFRGSTGYGKAFLNAGDREWGNRMHFDLLDGVDWAVKQGIADPGKICIYGGSYGGYATLAGLAFTPDVFACGVDIVGPSNLITLLKSFPPYWSTMKAMFERRVGKLSEEEFMKSRSPLFSAGRIKSPLMIAQGAHDPRVTQQESDQIVQAMRKNGKDVDYLVFPDEGHGFARPENDIKFRAAAEAFMAKYLGGRCEPPSEKEELKDIRK